MKCLHKPVAVFPRKRPGQTFIVGQYQCKKCGRRLIKRLSTGRFTVAR